MNTEQIAAFKKSFSERFDAVRVKVEAMDDNDPALEIIAELCEVADEAFSFIGTINEESDDFYDKLLTEQGKNWRETVAPESVK